MAVTAIMTCLMPLLLSLKQQIKKMGLLDEIEGLDLVEFKSPFGFTASSVTLLDGYLVFRICLHSTYFVHCFSFVG